MERVAASPVQETHSRGTCPNTRGSNAPSQPRGMSWIQQIGLWFVSQVSSMQKLQCQHYTLNTLILDSYFCGNCMILWASEGGGFGNWWRKGKDVMLWFLPVMLPGAPLDVRSQRSSSPTNSIVLHIRLQGSCLPPADVWYDFAA